MMIRHCLKASVAALLLLPLLANASPPGERHYTDNRAHWRDQISRPQVAEPRHQPDGQRRADTGWPQYNLERPRTIERPRDEHSHYRDHDGRYRDHDGRFGNHDGRHGASRIIGAPLYFYPTPAPVVTLLNPYPPRVTIAPSAPPQFWYYCPNPAGYYPYVAQCAFNWHRVPATAAPIVIFR